MNIGVCDESVFIHTFISVINISLLVLLSIAYVFLEVEGGF